MVNLMFRIIFKYVNVQSEGGTILKEMYISGICGYQHVSKINFKVRIDNYAIALRDVKQHFS